MTIASWAAGIGAKTGRNPSGGPHEWTPEMEGTLVARALRPWQRERLCGFREVRVVARAVADERYNIISPGAWVREDAEAARSAGVGTGAVAWIAHALGNVFAALTMFFGLAPITVYGILGLVQTVTPYEPILTLDRQYPWLSNHLLASILVYPFLCAAVNDVLETIRRLALRREYLAWAVGREGQVARGTTVLPEPLIFGAGMAALPAKIIPGALVVVILAALGVGLLEGHVSATPWSLLLIAAGIAAVLYGVSRLQQWRLRRIVLLHHAIAGPAGRLVDRVDDADTAAWESDDGAWGGTEGGGAR